MKVLGLRLNAKKSVLSPLQRTTYLGVVWDSTTMQARLSPARIESILAAVRRVREGQSLTVSSFRGCWVWWQLRPTWYLLACCTWDPYSGGSRPRGFPRGETHFAWSRHAAVPTCLRHVKTALVLVSGSRHPVNKKGRAEARGMDASPRGGEADLESVMARLRWTSSLLR